MDPLPIVLLTGFEPFGGDAFNPSLEIARRLDRWVVPGSGGEPLAHVRAEELPCVFGAALVALDRALRRHRPVVVIALGLAGSRTDIGVERVAINVDDARIPDNAGAQPIDRPIRAGGPAAYWSSLPIKAITADIRAAGYPVSVSQSAGTFVCNHVFYGLSHRLARQRPPNRARGGFIHVPYPVDLDRSGMAPSGPPLAILVEAIRIAVRVAVAHPAGDRVEGGGAID